MVKENHKNEVGYALAMFLIVMALGAIVVAGSLQLAGTVHRTTYADKKRSERLYQSESGLNLALNWLRQNSKSLLTPFKRDSFYSSFVKTTPSIGSNDSSFSVPTKIKIYGTTNSVILTNDSSFGTAIFPSTTSEDGATFVATSEFSSASFNNDSVRVTLVDAIAVDPSKDYGAPPNPEPETDFYPVYRVDAMTGTDQGTHVYGYLFGSLVSSLPYGFYGEDFVEAAQDCDSYISSSGAYSSATANANCPVTSSGQICIKNNATVYGSAATSDQMDSGSQCSGNICTTLDCSAEGDPCEGSSCNIPTMPTYQAWTSYCPSAVATRTVTVSANTTTTLTVPSAAPADSCWASVSVPNKATLNLTTTAYPYYIKTLDLADSLQVNPDTANGVVTLFVEEIVGDKINGNQVVNSASRPAQFKIIYLGTDDLVLNGNADMYMALIAPYAGVSIKGNSDFYGGVIAKDLTMTGNGDIHYDESLSEDSISDIRFTLRQVSQYYR